MKKSLNGDWLFKQSDKQDWLPAVVPGCNFLDLMANGLIKDPFIGLNEQDCDWVGKTDFEYKKTFCLSDAELECDEIRLCAKALDTVCDVRVNGKLAFSENNCFVEHKYDVKSLLKSGENEISVYFHSPVNYVKQMYKQCSTPVNSNGQNGIVHIRKPQCHFGWDWGPVLPLSGITDDIYLEIVSGAVVDLLNVNSDYVDEKGIVSVSVDYTSYADTECEIVLTSPDGSQQSVVGENAEFVVDNLELWWSYDLTDKKEQPLYTVSVRLLVDGKTVDESSKKIGIRHLELNTKRDEYGKNFQFVLNGVPIFAKGANYIPADSFITRFTKDKLDYLLDAVQFSNMNIVRIWGGGYYASDAFYDECDKRGILVWQDFMFACQAYPFFNDDFLANVKREVAYNTARICSHPSLALWCGNNEIEDMHMAWINMPKYIEYTEKFFYNILEPEIRKFDSVTSFTPGSPVGKSHNEGVYADNVGDTHLWGVWHGLKPMDYYRRRMNRFCSEFGFESLPDMNTVRTFAEPKDYDLNSKVFLSHQKCMNGNDKMVYYIAGRFDLPKHFKDYVYLSQVTQLECIADATEHWRRNKGRCNGSMYWQLNDCWGVCSWSGIDYYGNYKALQYGARHFNQPLTVSFENSKDDVKVFVLNDYRQKQDVTLEISLFDFQNGIIDTVRYDVEQLEMRCSFDVPPQWLKSCDKRRNGILAVLYKNGCEVSRRTLLFDKEKNLLLPKAKLSTRIEINGSDLTLRIKSDSFARLVKAECSATHLPFSDNFFDLLANEEKVITMHLDSTLSPKEIAQSIVVYSLSDIELNKNKLNSFAKRAKVWLSPVNIANAVHHGKVPRDVKLD